MRWTPAMQGRPLLPALPVLLIAGEFVRFIAIPQVMFGGADDQHLLVNVVLYLVVLAVWLAWLFLYRAGACSVESGAGLGLAAHAVVLRSVGELSVWYVDWARHEGRSDAPEAFVAAMATWTRSLGAIGVAFGLAMVAAAVVVDRWAKCRLPGGA